MKKPFKKIISLINELKVILIILLVVFGLFYWYKIKSSKIEAECSGFAFKILNIDGHFESFDIAYGICIRNGGVENTYKIIEKVEKEIEEIEKQEAEKNDIKSKEDLMKDAESKKLQDLIKEDKGIDIDLKKKDEYIDIDLKKKDKCIDIYLK